MRYRVTHRTSYSYSEPVTTSHHAARVEPRTGQKQQRTWSNLTISPEPAVRKTRSDYFGNSVCFFSVQELHQRLEIVSESVVKLEPGSPPDLEESPAWEDVAAALREPVAPATFEAQQFVYESPHVRPSAELAAFAAPSFKPGRPLLESMGDLNNRIHQSFTFDPTATTVATRVEDVLKLRRGVCQDFTHIALGCIRSLGLAGRYVSGYLRTYPAREEPVLVGADASHAWISIFCPRHGWIDFDPTNDLIPSAEHIAVAYGRDFADVSPVTGIITGGGEHRVGVAVAVEVLEPTV